MKTVSLDTLGGGSIEELRREIDVQKSLDHPNIVRLFEYFEDSQRHVIHIVMELCTGGALVSRMKAHRHGYGEQEARRLVSKVGCVAGRAPLLGWAPTIIRSTRARHPHTHTETGERHGDYTCSAPSVHTHVKTRSQRACLSGGLKPRGLGWAGGPLL